MEAIKNSVEHLIDHAGDLAETYYKLTVVKATEKASKTVATGVFAVIAAVIGVLGILFIGFGVAWWVGEALDNFKAGFFIVGGFYFLLLLLLIAIRKNVLFPMVRNSIIKSVYEEQD